MGYHPLFIIARGILHMFLYRPYIVGGATMIMAYFWAGLRGRKRMMEPSVIRYVRRTQLKQLAGLLAGKAVHK